MDLGALWHLLVALPFGVASAFLPIGLPWIIITQMLAISLWTAGGFFREYLQHTDDNPWLNKHRAIEALAFPVGHALGFIIAVVVKAIV